MELKINEFQLPDKIGFNYEELKQELTEKVSMYESLVYTEDNIKEAKADRAKLNNLKKALNDERIRMEREYMNPFIDFKMKVTEIIKIIEKPVSIIDQQIKGFEEQKKQDKLDSITAFFNDVEHPEWLHISQLFDDKWLNASVSMKAVQEAIITKIEKVSQDLATLSNLPEFGFEATEVYKLSLDMNKAISEGHRLSEIAAKKREYEATQAAQLAKQMADAEFAKNMNPPVEDKFIPPVVDEEFEAKAFEPEKQWIKFKAHLTVDQARELKKFFDDRAILFEAI